MDFPIPFFQNHFRKMCSARGKKRNSTMLNVNCRAGRTEGTVTKLVTFPHPYAMLLLDSRNCPTKKKEIAQPLQSGFQSPSCATIPFTVVNELTLPLIHFHSNNLFYPKTIQDYVCQAHLLPLIESYCTVSILSLFSLHFSQIPIHTTSFP